MPFIWDYDVKELEKTKEGRIKILERQINYGVDSDDKIKLSLVKKYWKELSLEPLKRELFKLLIWGKKH